MLLELAMLEQREGNASEARSLFQQASDPNMPIHPPLIEAWIAFEKSQRNYEAVESLLKMHENVCASQAQT